jgi:tetratricopeptide (TPR) repeat protein
VKILRHWSLSLLVGLAGLPAAAPAMANPPVVEAEASAKARADAVAACERGAAALAANRIGEAKRLFEQALALYPAYPRALYELGRLEALNGRDAEAIARFEATLALAPDFVRARHALGEVHRRAGRDADAERAFRRVLADRPNDVESLRGLAFVHERAGREAEALHLLERVTTATVPSDPVEREIADDARRRVDALKSKGVVAKAPDLKPLPEPVVPAAPAVAETPPTPPSTPPTTPPVVATPTTPGAFAPLGGEKPLPPETPGGADPLVTASRVEALLESAAVLYSEKQYMAALATLDKARTLAPDQASIAYRQGVVEALLQNFAAARRHWEDALRLGGPRPLITRHLALIANRQPATAAETADLRTTWLAGRHLDALVLARHEDSPLASRIEADALMALGMHQEALARYDELLGADPTDRLALAGRAEALVMLGRKDAAETARAAFQGSSLESGWEPVFVFRRTELRRVVQASLVPPKP